MKKKFTFAIVFLAAHGLGLSLSAAVIDQVLVRQQWPWSTDVKIEYRISGLDGSAPVDIVVTAYNGDVPLDSSKLPESLSGDIHGIAENGVGTILLDPIRAFGTDKTALADFNVELSVKDSAENVGEVLYKVVDLNTGAVSDIRRRDFLNGKCGAYETDFARIGSGFSTTLGDVLVWTAVTNRTDFLTEKMLFRKIPAKGVVWQMGETESTSGADSSPAPFWATLDADYYLSVFPVTQAQFAKFRDGYCGEYFTEAEDHLLYPVADMYLGDVLRSQPASFLSRMKATCGLDINLPTEAQWEFACRGGTYAKTLYSGSTFGASAIRALAWCSDNSDGSMQRVGRKPANAYGLYEMLGNVAEYCLDRGFTYPTGTSRENPVVNPGNAADSGNFVVRGGAYNDSRLCMRAAYREFRGGTDVWARSRRPFGFRVCFPAD